jgi:hypothetical protein
MTLAQLLKRPSAFLPIAMSLAALSIVLGTVAIFGVPHDADEGTAAHIFQLLIVAQLPIVAVFVIKWVPRAPSQGLRIMALQAGAGIAALAPVYLLHL